jgi:hypothetical protein
MELTGVDRHCVNVNSQSVSQENVNKISCIIPVTYILDYFLEDLQTCTDGCYCTCLLIHESISASPSGYYVLILLLQMPTALICSAYLSSLHSEK